MRTFVSNDKSPFLVPVVLAVFASATQSAVADERSKSTDVVGWANADLSDREYPAGFIVERYTRLWERNPFTLPSDAAPGTRRSTLQDLYLIGWLNDGYKEMIYVQNSQTNEVQRITPRPNHNNLRLVEIHLNSNLRRVDAVIAADQEQVTVKFRFDSQVAPGLMNSTVADTQTNTSSGEAPANKISRYYPGIPRVRSEGSHPLHDKRSKFAPKVNALVPGQS